MEFVYNFFLMTSAVCRSMQRSPALARGRRGATGPGWPTLDTTTLVEQRPLDAAAQADPTSYPGLGGPPEGGGRPVRAQRRSAPGY